MGLNRSFYIGPHFVCTNTNGLNLFLPDELADRLYGRGMDQENDFHIFLPNIKIEGIDRQMSVSADESAYIYSVLNKAKDESLLFMTRFYDEMEILQKRYGDDNVKIRWGIVSVCG